MSAFTVRSGPWSAAQISDYLTATAIPVRLASSGSYPLVQSLWFLFDGDSLWCATQEDSVLAQRIRRDDRVGFEVSSEHPPYRGVRGTGHAHLERAAAADLLPRLIDRYLGAEPTPLASWLMSRIDSELAICIDGLSMTSWDFSARM